MARSNYRLPKIPEMTIRRLSVYTRCLLQLEEDGVRTVSSQELAERFNLNSAQVRKDLAYFGEFGVRGIGYYVAGLKAELQRILGLDREWAVALVGFGNLGSALFHYKGFSRQGFRIAVESNGTVLAPAGIDWLCISPKAGAEWVQRSGQELKVVWPQPGLDLDVLEREGEFTHRFLQPMDGPEVAANTQLCIEICMRRPAWRLSLQTHKMTGIR